MPDTAALKNGFELFHGFWSNALALALHESPDLFNDYLVTAKVALEFGHLERKLCDFVMLAASASVTHLNREAITLHIEGATRHGATREEILEVLQIASVLGIHCLHGRCANFLRRTRRCQNIARRGVPARPSIRAR
ncbi:hypothetical protein BURKHO8Y_40053 [Burkholderia sp. 8Y]|uniref:carboxymuconolactone decarboxylase family protein n=1 Tax=Burkholderia sp. 8Y TaxID=2653133 RepID=UPI0012F2618F|nr:carboxymuconolactone decarboxylase family protein [Burkholderia sp. 8Y]VXC80482.1 hypothetical protein BURKHO8Y_40053 [Burkholderia sp. 8Y]